MVRKAVATRSFNLWDGGKVWTGSERRSDEGVALRAALSAAPEPRPRRVSAIRLQSLTQEGGGCGDLARAPSSHSSLRGLASITCFRLMRVARYQDLNSQARKARDARSTAGP